MNSLILVLLIPFATAIALALFGGPERARFEKALSAVSCLASTAYSFWLLAYVDAHGIQVSMIAGYGAPYGIAFVADHLTCIMLCLSTALASIVVVYTFWTVTPEQQGHFFYALFQVLLLGVNWSFITGDLFNLFVAYEVMLIGSYGVMMVGASRQQVRQTMMYVAVNLLGGALFVVGIGLIYALVGTLNMADIARITTDLTGPRAALLTAASMLLFVVFALKAAAFPLFFWLPESYPIVPAGVNGYFAGMLTKVGVYSLLRVFVMVFRQEGHGFALELLLVLSAFTMVLGVLGAVCQWEIRRILAWHSISQVGYMVMGIGLASDPALAPAAIVATILFIVHHAIVKSCLFLIGGVAEDVTGARKLKQMGGVLVLAPAAAGLFLVAALSLAGLPPFSGFVGKLVLLRVGLDAGRWWIVAAAVVTSFFTLLSMLKIWSYAFWRTPRDGRPVTGWQGTATVSAVLVVATIVLGVATQPFLRLAGEAATEVAYASAYVKAVLEAPVPDNRHADATPLALAGREVAP